MRNAVARTTRREAAGEARLGWPTRSGRGSADATRGVVGQVELLDARLEHAPADQRADGRAEVGRQGEALDPVVVGE